MAQEETNKLRRPEEDLWVERYRPRKVEDLIVPERVRKRVEKGLDNNMILYGKQGNGKTSTAHILAEPYTSKYINASLHNSIQDVRDHIVKFVKQMSLDGAGKKSGIKVVILDEIEGVSEAFMKSLRGVVEGYSKHARFIATTNEYEKMPKQMKSRFDSICFDWTEDEEVEVKKRFAMRIAEVCKNEGMSIDNEAVLQIVSDHYPDIRSSINLLQGIRMEDVDHVTVDHLQSFHGVFTDLYEMVFAQKPDPVENYKELSKYKNKVDSAIEALGRGFIEYINKEKPNARPKIGEIVDEVNDHAWQRNFSLDPFVTLLDLVYKLQNIVSK